MPTLIVYAGPNGAGKSTLRDMGTDTVDVVIDTDRIARALVARDANTAQMEAGRQALQLFDETLARGNSISLETTLSGLSVLRRMKRAKNAGYTIELRYIALESADLHIKRVFARVKAGGHSIPPETIRRRYDRSLDNLPEALCLADLGFVSDNAEGCRRDLMRSIHGTIIYQDARLPMWLQKRMPEIMRALERSFPG